MSEQPIAANRPYYEDEWVTLHHGDCLDVLPTLDLTDAVVITDPPYNVGIEYGDGTNDRNTGYETWCGDWFAMLSDSACIAISPGIANMGLWTRIAGDPDWTICWHKPASMGRCAIGFNNWEPVMVWGKSRGPISADVFTAPLLPDPALEGHPCPKPVQWGRSLVAMLSKPDDLIIDPFAGSGTILVAAKHMNRRAVCIEIESAYCGIAVARMGQEVLNLAV